jgi:hypothetical protein
LELIKAWEVRMAWVATVKVDCPERFGIGGANRVQIAQ